MRRTVIIIEHPDYNGQWIAPYAMCTNELANLVYLIQTGKAGFTPYERHVSQSGAVVSIFTDIRSTIDGVKQDSLVEVPYSQENASEMFLDRDGL